ncbi:annexin-2 receptor-like [Sciurus carolinensis]|uniref:annexin-2 receptor-like n=1 Tax=Sciurus carolinensis TaxID=30640 RepID=UPI001FB3C385|nr:annexin-2 receptor-like [Sciurus carolinensis]
MGQPFPYYVSGSWDSPDQGPGTSRPPALSSIYSGSWLLPFFIHRDDISYDNQDLNCDLLGTLRGRLRWDWSGKGDFPRAHSTLHQDTMPPVLDRATVTQKKPQAPPGKSGVSKVPRHRLPAGAPLACSRCISDGYLEPKTCDGSASCKSCLPPSPAHRHGTSQGCWEWIRSLLRRSP